MSGPDTRRPGPPGWAGRLAAGTAAAFVLLAVAVRLGFLDGADLVVGRLARPGEAWGCLQQDADRLVDGLRPTMLAAPMAALVAGVCAVRRSWRPAAVSVVVLAVTAAVTLGAKAAVGRPDGESAHRTHGGSFPSGHTATVVVVFGLALLLLQPGGRTRRWLWAVPASLGTAMAACLVVVGQHRASDVAGAALLGTAILAVVRRSGADVWSARAGGGGSGGHGPPPGRPVRARPGNRRAP